MAEKRPEYATRHDAIIFHHDNARPHVAIPVNNYLENSRWEVLPHPRYSPDFVRQAGAVLLGWNPQIARTMGKSHNFRWAIL